MLYMNNYMLRDLNLFKSRYIKLQVVIVMGFQNVIEKKIKIGE